MNRDQTLIPATQVFHPADKYYVTRPPVHYTHYRLADVCHFFNGVPEWNTKPFVVEFEHVLALGGFIADWQYSLQRTVYIHDIIASPLCRLALAQCRAVMRHSLRYITDESLHKKFDYLYQGYPSQPTRVMDMTGPFSILTIATRFYDKGVPIALKVFQVLRQRYPARVRMTLVCDVIPTDWPIPEGVTVLTDRPLSDAMKAQLFGQAHAFFLPMLSEGATCLIEAYAYGTPVVTTRIVYGDELVQPGATGFLVDPPFYSHEGVGTRWKTWEDFVTCCKESYEQGDCDRLIEQCVDCLDHMIRGDVDIRRMSSAAQQFHRETFSLEAHNSRLREIYRKVAGS